MKSYRVQDTMLMEKPLSGKHRAMGLRWSKEYNSWVGMRSRCHNKNHVDYYAYGARGVVVCDRWRESFVNFYRDMGPKPDATYSIDRIDVNGNYEPSNCRWASKSSQSHNQRQDNIRGYDFIKGKYRVRLCIDGKQKTLGYFSTKEEASEVYFKAKAELLKAIK